MLHALLALFACGGVAVAQISVSVEALSASGVALIDENMLLQTQSIPVGQPFSQQETYRVSTHGTGSPYFIDYTETEITPPLNVGASSQNRVAIESRSYAKKTTLVPSLFTTGAVPGQPGTQRFRITLSSSTPQNVELDTWCQGRNIGNATHSISMMFGATTQTWSYVAGQPFSADHQVWPIVLNGVMTVDVEIVGQVTPGPGGGLYSDGYDTRWSMTVVPINTGAISYWGTGCGSATLSHVGVPTTGSMFTLNVTGAPAGAPVFFVLGTTTQFVPFLGMLLPLDLGAYGAPGCTLYVGSPALWWLQPGSGLGQTSIDLYLNPWYSGLYHVQGLVFDPVANNLGVTLTQAATLNY